MIIVDERQKNNGERFGSLSVGEFFHERYDDDEDGTLYIKVSNGVLETESGEAFNVWSVNDNCFYLLSDDEYVIRQHIKITLTD